MEDYKKEIRHLLLTYYSPEPVINSKKIYRSTVDILEMLLGILPETAITQHDVYEQMKEIGFQSLLFFLDEEEKILWQIFQLY